ncbi:MAG: hypothetical protein L3J39_04390 [Verrucomicrobiales bacterium]|nr:hypothetical protein [Verrucomicrobiales bacterium]
MMEATAGLDEIRIHFGEAQTARLVGQGGLGLNLDTVHLGGPTQEVLFQCEGAEQELVGDFSFYRDQGRMAGVAVVDCPIEEVESAAQGLYHDLLLHTQGLKLQRLWNFVPRINDESLGQEVYRSFNEGRWKAFAGTYGEENMDLKLPAATAVGLQGECERLALVFLAGEQEVAHFENPRQTPAYRYPSEFGPCSPSFARGTVVSESRGRVAYLSGTSSICGSQTVGEGDLSKQISETIENIQVALQQMGFEGGLRERDCVAQLRVYVRDPGDYAEIRERLEAEITARLAEQVVYVQADICREPLKLEIEGVFRAQGEA